MASERVSDVIINAVALVFIMDVDNIAREALQR